MFIILIPLLQEDWMVSGAFINGLTALRMVATKKDSGCVATTSMANKLQDTNTDNFNVVKLPIEFIVVCLIVFLAALWATIYFNYTMGEEMSMPGGWRMSMMWMRMSGQTWFWAGLSFMLMWITM